MTTSEDLLPGDDLHSRARWLLTQLEPWQIDQLRAQAADHGMSLLDLCAHLLDRCERGES